jgi:hypothetical protein
MERNTAMENNETGQRQGTHKKSAAKENDNSQPTAEKSKAEEMDDKIKNQLAELQAQLEAMQANRKEKTERESTAEPKVDASEQPQESEAEAATVSDLSIHIQELIAGLNKELKEANPTILLAVFALGIVVGRLLSK